MSPWPKTAFIMTMIVRPGFNPLAMVFFYTFLQPAWASQPVDDWTTDHHLGVAIVKETLPMMLSSRNLVKNRHLDDG